MVAHAVDYKAVLGDLQAHKAELEREIAELDSVIGVMKKMSLQRNAPEGHAPSASPTERSRYRDKTIRDAAYECLKNNGRAMKTRQIAEALEAGGLQSSAKSLSNAVYATLTREQPRVFRVRDGLWSLAEWSRDAEDRGP